MTLSKLVRPHILFFLNFFNDSDWILYFFILFFIWSLCPYDHKYILNNCIYCFYFELIKNTWFSSFKYFPLHFELLSITVLIMLSPWCFYFPACHRYGIVQNIAFHTELLNLSMLRFHQCPVVSLYLIHF